MHESLLTLGAPLASVVIDLTCAEGDTVVAGAVVATVESMKMQYPVESPTSGVIDSVIAHRGQTVQKGQALMTIRTGTQGEECADHQASAPPAASERRDLALLQQRMALTLDAQRQQATTRRHAKGLRTARENLHDLVDQGSFVEIGQLAVAAQRSRRDYTELQLETAADGVLTGLGTINAADHGADRSRAAVAIYDYTVLAGTQGYFHHNKLDRIFELASQQQLPVVIYTEGGGGRPGDTDVKISIAGLNIPSFARWASLSGVAPRIAVNNGYCFAGNAALFGCADLTIATRDSWIGMAGPAMIEGGGLGVFEPTDIGPAEEQARLGVIDLLADDEAHATDLAKRLLGYFQGDLATWSCVDQSCLRDSVPPDRRQPYALRQIISTLADEGSWLELRPAYATGVVTGLLRLEGRAIGLIANDCKVLGGALEANAACKAARFLQLCDAFALPVLSLVDTPGFMVGPDSERQAAVRRMSSLFIAGASLSVPMVSIFLRKGYGLGAMAMTGGSFAAPVYAASWPSGEFGGMGLEGAVRLGYRKELDAAADDAERNALFDKLLMKMYELGKATEAASHLEIDAVIDPADTRRVICLALAATPRQSWTGTRRRNMIDTW